MDPVYVVMAEHGDYSNREVWVVAVYTTKEQAEDHARRANEYSAHGRDTFTGSLKYSDEHRRYDRAHPFDKYGGEYFEVVECPFVRHVDEFLDIGSNPLL